MLQCWKADFVTGESYGESGTIRSMRYALSGWVKRGVWGGRYDLVRKAGKARLDQLVRREGTIL